MPNGYALLTTRSIFLKGRAPLGGAGAGATTREAPKRLEDLLVFNGATINDVDGEAIGFVEDTSSPGKVTRVKLLSHPGYGLDEIAVRQALGMSFEPARDGRGRAMPALVLWSFEWPSYWWLVAHEGVTTAQSGQMYGVPCRGSGPLHIGSIDPVYRDCSGPDVELAAHARWIAR